MAKRKAGVNDIIYELDNSDIEVSSDDEGKEAKIGRFVTDGSTKTVKNKNKDNKVLSHDNRKEIKETVPQTQNGGKTICDTTLVITKNAIEKEQSNHFEKSNINIEVSEGSNSQCSNTIFFDDDIDIGSPTANSDLGVVGCENKIPLVTVRFKDIKLAKIYKKQVKEFLVNLLKSEDTNNLSEADTDIEIDIWPEDLVDDHYNDEEIANQDDNLFFIDTDPCGNPESEIPTYSKGSHLISNISAKEESSPSTIRWKMACFNCDGEHSLRDCPLPRDNSRIAEKRKHIVKVGRYHVEDEQKYGHLMPGRISASLRSALGLKRYELPLHVYKMRLLGYPPGWLQDARISHSGIRLFDASGSAILDPDEEEGELNEPGSKDKFDIKKILDFPGFNVPASSRYVEEGHLFGFPPMSDVDSKMLMLQSLAPNAMKAYKRKKLMLFPANNSGTADGQMEMELDSGDEIPEFPSMPPLPDEAPPPPPPPPPPIPEEKPTNASIPNKSKVNKSSKKKTKNKNYNANEDNTKDNENNDSENNTQATKENKYNVSESNDRTKTNENNESDRNDNDDLEVLEVLHVPDIPVPGDDFIVIDEDYSVDNISVDSPTLADLEEEKRQLLSALKDGGDSQLSVINISDTVDTNDDDVTTDLEEIEALLDDAAREQNEKDEINEQLNENNHNPVSDKQNNTNKENIDKSNKKETNVDKVEKDIDIKTDIIDDKSVKQDENESKPEETLTPNIKTGKVKTTLYGTPVINVASPFLKLPGEEKFSKDICDIINFENLPNSTGKYKQISKLLKKVKSEVDRIQDS